MADLQLDQGTILVVEDDPGQRRLVRRQLEAVGYRILEAPDLSVALAMLRSGEPIDLLFTDLIFPGNLTGQDLAREARRRRPGLRVLYTSGFFDSSVRTEMDGAQMLAKPYEREQLVQHVRDALASPPSAGSTKRAEVGAHLEIPHAEIKNREHA
jgi:CheY-like chemotaxis protein